jgi:hypothetical protein
MTSSHLDFHREIASGAASRLVWREYGHVDLNLAAPERVGHHTGRDLTRAVPNNPAPEDSARSRETASKVAQPPWAECGLGVMSRTGRAARCLWNPTSKVCSSAKCGQLTRHPEHLMIVSTFGRYLSRSAHDHETAGPRSEPCQPPARAGASPRQEPEPAPAPRQEPQLSQT